MKQLTSQGMLQNTFKQALKCEPQPSASSTCVSATVTSSSYILDDKYWDDAL
jgi:hypothetical protein